MSRYDYEVSKVIERHGWPFYALIMAALRQADTDNVERLRRAFPETYNQLIERYHAPDGILPGEE